MDRANTGLNERLKKTKAIAELGQGMDAGSLNEYSHQISLYLLLKVFKREINNNEQRSRSDLLQLTVEILKEMRLEINMEEVERLVDGVLYSGDPKQQSYFHVKIYDETAGDFKDFKYRYLIPDREASNWQEGGSTVYRLSEISQEIIFITREILQEFGFDLEQFYTLQLIKNGNFKEAKGSVSNLIARVRNLIKKEKDWREDILRNPGLIFSAYKERRRRTEAEVREQFKEEKKVFSDIFVWRDRLDTFENADQKEGELLFEELERARSLHDYLAELTVSNLSLELQLRRENPDIFWQTSRLSFKKDFWQNTVLKSGLPQIDDLEKMLNPLFSPEQDFIFPLDWAWSEQQLYSYLEESEGEIATLEIETAPEREIDWGLVVELWQHVFTELFKKGEFKLSALNKLSPEQKEKWLSQQLNLELFMMFIITDIKLKIVEEYPGLDERLLLFNKLVKVEPELAELEGRKISARLTGSSKKVNLLDQFIISPYKIYLEED
ncbi:MAG: hypothetical protein A8274_427 [Halanaerobium sp. 4-GBenrich]|jgi:hypothetical protein|uniref:Uncharacterized protein n=1 Tax=Halanaerobium congolense TaxID=54121 RepID=A0A1G9UZ51_9FIRM|nr:hypothetical protein [Halanaerobium congolense]ODS50611.1 MAG: hypothetical protein A8274_427 [Halanaerobium sp. 4-GBenrich]PTX16272.1 hypothetical protein C7953_0979 [Halanaerobium congolense]TDS28464.1 hypothetical protein BY453_12127 [Halanaerobium congolense]SDF75720.1 hypothetical protein SAMN04488598_12313 [Halanaerobium congolense]SDK84910.1 hypothetical protein SAMN04515655_12113 [Halanaerobium congolense]